MQNDNNKNVQNKLSPDDELVKIALSRGLFFPAAEIFGDSIAGTWDYGPIGLSILNNIISVWRGILHEINAIEVAGSLILPKIVLQASGHEVNFFDVGVVCSKCGSVYRVDKLLEEKEPSRNYEGLSDEDYLGYINAYGLSCEKCGGELNKLKKFGSMFGLQVGVQSFDGKEDNAYLRPEACQSIFLDFKRLFSLYGKKLPLIMGQVGKAFRNEMSPRNNLIRQREFYQNDIEIFFSDEGGMNPINDAEINIFDKNGGGMAKVKISDALSSNKIAHKVTAFGLSIVSKFLGELGFSGENIRYRKLYEDKAFYAQEAFDVEIKKGDDWVEAIACNHRGDHDLAAYAKLGGETVKIDGKTPNIFEISAGTDRLFYLSLYNSIKSDSERVWFALNGKIAPFKAAVFPLLTKPDLKSFADKLSSTWDNTWEIYRLNSGSIGKMYRKADEIGIPIAITIDFQTLKDGTVTVRGRDTMQQFRADSKNFHSLVKYSTENDFESLRKQFEIHL